MLGSVADSEDVVQEAFARLLGSDITRIEDIRGWLVVVVGRLCLDQLKSARARREAYVGPWFPEPIVDAPVSAIDPVEQITLDDSVRIAMLVVLERLTPAERAAFVLHDVFRFPFDEIASIVGRSPQAARQLASRARKRIQDETEPARFAVSHEQLRAVADRFIEAASQGDLAGLMQVLAPDVIGWTDGGGRWRGRTDAVRGRERVAKQFLRFVRGFELRLVTMPINGEPGIVCFAGDRLLAVIALDTRDGLITRFHGIANPDKLAYVASILGVEVFTFGKGQPPER
jgi:RNA polymerase sigma-70 factor (ECF subfamily)